MARNKKTESDFRLVNVLIALMLFGVFVPSGIGFVWFKDQIDVMGDQIKKKETALAELERENRIRSDQLAALCLPEALDRQVKKMNLGLDRPTQAQIVRLTETPLEPAPPADQRRAQAVVRERSY